jgi:hypothetical protein
MKLAFAAVNTLVAFQSLIICSEIYELNKHIGPILQNQHPIFVRHGNVSLPDKNFENLHAEEISSLLVYDFQKLQIQYANVTHLTQNIRVVHYSIFIWTRFPSFIHIFPNNTNEEVYNLQYKFFRNSGLGLMTRPKINSVIITLEHSTVHHKNDADRLLVLRYKELVEKLVDYYDFALHFKLEDTKPLDFELFEISSVSVWKFCTDCSAAFEVSLFHFESCEKSPLNIQNNFDCVDNILQIVSDSKPGLNLSRFGIEFKAYDLDFTQTYGNCLSQSIFKNYIASPFSNNFKNVSVQNLLLEELVRGLPASFNCVWEENRNLIVINLRFFPLRIDEENHWRNKYDFQASSSLQNQGAFNFLTCDGVRKKTDFVGYLEPFDTKIWFATISSLLLCSSLMAILVTRSPNTSFIDSCFRSFFMNFSFLTGVANAPLKLMVNYRLNTTTILLLCWAITTIVLCCVYSSLVTTNVIAPKLLVSSWTEYKQLKKFTKVFGLSSEQEMSRMDTFRPENSIDWSRILFFATGSRASYFWFIETITNQPAEHKSTGACDQFHIDSSNCQGFRRKSFEFVNSYTYAVRSDVEKLKEKLSVCTNTAFIDTETSIDNFLHIWNQDEGLPSMVKGNSFYQQSYSWTMGYTWLLRKVMSSRMKAFTTSGIIGFWERFCLKYCKMQSEISDVHNTIKNFNAVTFKPQKLASNMTSLFLIMLIISAVSILCFVGEYLFSRACKCFSQLGNYRTDIKCHTVICRCPYIGMVLPSIPTIIYYYYKY